MCNWVDEWASNIIPDTSSINHSDKLLTRDTLRLTIFFSRLLNNPFAARTVYIYTFFESNSFSLSKYNQSVTQYTRDKYPMLG